MLNPSPNSSANPFGASKHRTPLAMFTPVFAVARTVGWVAHWNEMIADPETRLVRPRQLYAGPAARATHGALVG
jgi:citrate synthase